MNRVLTFAVTLLALGARCYSTAKRWLFSRQTRAEFHARYRALLSAPIVAQPTLMELRVRCSSQMARYTLTNWAVNTT